MERKKELNLSACLEKLAERLSNKKLNASIKRRKISFYSVKLHDKKKEKLKNVVLVNGSFIPLTGQTDKNGFICNQITFK